MPTFERGNVARVPFSYSDQVTRQRRPALVVSNGPIERDHTLLWVAMITSAGNAGWPDDVPLERCQSRAGLSAPSVIRPCKLAAIESADCAELGDVDAATIAATLTAIHKPLGSPS